ncbi:MAG TPA: TonB-dependent receptor, partial [Lentisphaeria bacterium]|nr:TonB-dependent receptor [Lentisphaeria bacterium]
MRRLSRLMLLAWLCAPWVACAEADATGDPLPELRVTSTRSDELLLEAPLAITVISRAELDASPKRTVADVLRDVPGLTVETLSTPGMPRITIRGESANRVLILQDGQRLSEQKSMNGPPVLFTCAGVERIEVIRGPASVLYGSEAVGGVVNIITRRKVEVPLTGTVELSADSATRGWGTAVTLDGFSEGWEYGLSGLRLEHDDRRTPEGTVKPTSYDMDDIATYVGWRNETLSIQARYERFTSSVSSAPPPTLPAGLTSFYAHIPDWNREKLSIHAELHELSEHLTRLSMDLYAQESVKNFDQRIGASAPAGPFTMKVLVDSTVWNRLRTYGGSIQTDWTLPGGHYLIGGFDFMVDQLDDKDRATSTISGLPVPRPPTHSLNEDDALQTQLALFLRDEWAMNSDWTMDFGMRHTWVYSRLDETTRAYPEETQRDDASVFSATLLNRSFENLTLRLGFGQGYRFPSLLELYTGTRHSDNGSDVLPNADLDAERTNSFEFGGRYENGRLSVDSALFFSDARDYITMPRVNPTTYQYANVDESQAFGWEWQIAYVINPDDAL